MRARTVSEEAHFQRGKDPRSVMGIGVERDRKYLGLEKGDIIEAWSPNEDRWVRVQAIEEKIANNWSSSEGTYYDIKVKVLDPKYHSGLYDDDYQMIRVFINHFDTWELIEMG